MRPRRLALVLGIATLGVLLVMVAISLATGETQEAHEHYLAPADYAARLLAHPSTLRLIFGLDVAFLVLYTAFFAAFATFLRDRLAWIGFVAMAVVAVLDLAEDHHILALLAMAERGRPIDDGAIAFQDVLSATKFGISFIALFFYGIAIPRTTKLGWLLAIFLTAGTLVTAVAGVAVPGSLDDGRWIGFVVGFGVALAWLRAAPEPE
jgi:hypothetical protein